MYVCLQTEKGWSQSYVVEKIDVSINTISSIENGAQQFNLAILLQFSSLYDVSTDYILSRKKQEMQDRELVDKIRQIPVRERKRVMAAIEAFYAQVVVEMEERNCYIDRANVLVEQSIRTYFWRGIGFDDAFIPKSMLRKLE